MSKKSGFLIGAALGAAAALLFAPKKGSELREKVGKAYDDFAENPQDTLNNWRDTAVDFSADKFNDIKAKFDSGEISADKARDFLLDKRDQIKAKVDSGELSKDTVIDFFNTTREAIISKLNAARSETSELFDENESDLADHVAEAASKVEDKAEDVKDQAEDLINP